jgi:hypothetical protein
MDMLERATSFARHTMACQACYDVNADSYVESVHS